MFRLSLRVCYTFSVISIRLPRQNDLKTNSSYILHNTSIVLHSVKVHATEVTEILDYIFKNVTLNFWQFKGTKNLNCIQFKGSMNMMFMYAHHIGCKLFLCTSCTQSVPCVTKVWHFIFLLGTFPLLQKAPISIVISIHLFVCWSTHISVVPPDGFMSNLILGTVMKICQQNPNLVKIEHKYWAICMKT
jgi:hypothetical protein